jgi:WD40 repeat protein
MLSRDGFLISGSADSTIKLWNVKTGEVKATLAGHESDVLSLAISNDGQFLISGSFKKLKIWNTRNGKQIKTLNVHENSV